MSQTEYQRIEKPADREGLFEIFLQPRFDEIGAIFGHSHIEGLELEWVSSSSVKVKTGAADLPDKSRRLRVTAEITVSSISLGNNQWGHVYLYSNAGVPAAEVVTTAPAGYFGAAYQKTGDTSRRYLGSVRTDGSGNIRRFQHEGEWMFYVAGAIAVLSNGTATTETNVDCTGAVPATSRLLLALVQNTGSAVFWIGNSADGVTQPGAGNQVLSAGDAFDSRILLDSGQQFSYALSAAGSGAYAYVRGYRFER